MRFVGEVNKNNKKIMEAEVIRVNAINKTSK